MQEQQFEEYKMTCNISLFVIYLFYTMYQIIYMYIHVTKIFYSFKYDMYFFGIGKQDLDS